MHWRSALDTPLRLNAKYNRNRGTIYEKFRTSLHPQGSPSGEVQCHLRHLHPQLQAGGLCPGHLLPQVPQGQAGPADQATGQTA